LKNGVLGVPCWNRKYLNNEAELSSTSSRGNKLCSLARTPPGIEAHGMKIFANNGGVYYSLPCWSDGPTGGVSLDAFVTLEDVGVGNQNNTKPFLTASGIICSGLEARGRGKGSLESNIRRR
jgi:hypothetical protein